MLKLSPSIGLWGRSRKLAVDAASSDSAFGTSLTFSHTCSGQDRALIVGVTMAADSDNILSVTYGGVAMTFVGGVERASGTSGNIRSEQWKLSNPLPGANDVVITLDGVTDTTIVGGAVSFIGARQVTADLTGTQATNSGSSTTPSVACTSAPGEIVVDAVANAVGTLSVGAGQDERWNVGGSESGGSTEAGAASVTMSWTSDTSSAWATCAVSVKPAL